MRFLHLVLVTLWCSFSSATVDMRTANFAETITFLNLPGTGYDLKFAGTVQTRTVYTGLLGFGWCSDIETTMTLLPEGTIRVSECGAGMETIYNAADFKKKNVDSVVKTIISETKKVRKDLSTQYFVELEKELYSNNYLREEFAKRLNLKAKPVVDQVYSAFSRQNESIVFKEGRYKRTMADLTYQLFDENGNLTHMYDRNGNFLKINREKNRIVSVSDNNGRKITFKYDEVTRKIASAIGPEGFRADFTIKGDDLRKVVRTTPSGKKEEFTFDYDDTHNLTLAKFPDKTFKKLTYNKDKDWVMSFENERGCIENYDYQINPEDPKGHYWSSVIKKCGDKVTYQAKHEFWQKARKDGDGMYLLRTRSDDNGDVTDITFHDTFNRPVIILKNAFRTEYQYYDTGMLKLKKEPFKNQTFEYKNACLKVSSIFTEFLMPVEQKRTSKEKDAEDVASNANDRNVAGKKAAPKKSAMHVAKKVRIDYAYEVPKCLLTSAKSSEGQTINISYDNKGRVTDMKDPVSKKLLEIGYERRFGKPEKLALHFYSKSDNPLKPEQTLGSVLISYTNDGDIEKVKSPEGEQIASRIFSLFNNYVELIAPAAAETNI